MPTLIKVQNKGQVTIPNRIRSKAGLTKGDLVEATFERGKIVLTPRAIVDPDDVLTPKEGALLKKAEREMRQGKYVTLAKLNHELARKRSPRSRKTAWSYPPRPAVAHATSQ